MARTRGSDSEITGTKVREAALRLFARHGYAAVSMRQIAAEVGVQAGALYNYTPDKQHLLFSLLKSHMEAVLKARAARPRLSDPMARLEEFCRFHICHHQTNRDAVFISYMELRNLSPQNLATITRLRSRYEGELERILRDGREAGVFSVIDTKVASFALIGMLTSFGVWYREGGRLSRETIEDLYWDMVRRVVQA